MTIFWLFYHAPHQETYVNVLTFAPCLSNSNCWAHFVFAYTEAALLFSLMLSLTLVDWCLEINWNRISFLAFKRTRVIPEHVALYGDCGLRKGASADECNFLMSGSEADLAIRFSRVKSLSDSLIYRSNYRVTLVKSVHCWKNRWNLFFSVYIVPCNSRMLEYVF